MNKNKIKVSFDWDPNWNNESLQNQIEVEIIKTSVNKFISNIEANFTKKIEELVFKRVSETLSNIDEITITPCSINGIKEPMTFKQFIIKKAIESFEKGVNYYGEINGSRDYKNITEYIIKKELLKEKGVLSNKLQEEINFINDTYIKSLNEMVTKTLGPIYKELLKELKKIKK